MSENELVMESLDLHLCSLDGIDDQLLARAVVRMKTVDLVVRPEISTDQITTLLQAILAENELVMECLEIKENNLSEVDDQLLSMAVARIEMVGLYETNLTKKLYDPERLKRGCGDSPG